MTSANDQAKAADCAYDPKVLSTAALAVFIISFFLPFVVQSDARLIGTGLGCVLSLIFALLSRRRLVSRVVLCGLATVLVLSFITHFVFHQRRGEEMKKFEQERAAQLEAIKSMQEQLKPAP